MNRMENNRELLKKAALTEVQDLLVELGIRESGLCDAEVAASRKRNGGNDLSGKRKDSVACCIRRAFVNPFSMILFFLGIISFFTDILLAGDGRGNPAPVLIIFSMLVLSGIVRLSQELKAKKVADTLTGMVGTSVRALRKGRWMEIPSSAVVVGDQVCLEAGDRVPADIRVCEAADLFVSQSVITGESAILEKTASALSESPQAFSDYANILFSGSAVTGGRATGLVLAVGADTVYGGLNLASPGGRRGFDRGANSIAWVMIRFMAVLVPFVFLACGLTKGNWPQAFLFALSVAVGLTPELLPMVVNACLARGSRSMGEKQTIVKDINAMQAFGSMDVLCVDKTGTLTGDQVILEYYMDVLGNESRRTLDCAYLASVFHTGMANHLEKAIRKVGEHSGQKAYYAELAGRHTKLDERPFDHGRSFSSVLVSDGERNTVIIKGSVDAVTARCRYVEHAGRVTEMEGSPSSSVHSIVDEMLEDGMKVIAVAYRNCTGDCTLIGEERDFVLLGYLAFFDAPKSTAKSAIGRLHALNIGVKVLTGDDRPVAESVCRRLGIKGADAVITGPELDAMPENDIPVAVEKCNVFAQLSPRQKEHIVEVLHANGHTVGFLGDGMNDLPAVMRADVGISVENAAESVKDGASVILLKKDLNILEEGVLEGRKAFANMAKYIRITASSNFGNICAIVAAGILLPFFPMTSVQILLLNLLYDILCLVLPWDSVDQEILELPLEWSGRRLGGFMTFFGPLSSVFDLITFAALYYVICPASCGGEFAALLPEKQALFIAMFQTGWFLESMWTQVLILQLLRTNRIPFVQSRPAMPVIAVTAAGILLYTLLPATALGKMLGLCSMPAGYYLFLVAVVALYLLLVSLAKTVYIRRKGTLAQIGGSRK